MWQHWDEQKINLVMHDLVKSGHFGFQELLVATNVIFFDAENKLKEMCKHLLIKNSFYPSWGIDLNYSMFTCSSLPIWVSIENKSDPEDVVSEVVIFFSDRLDTLEVLLDATELSIFGVKVECLLSIF